MFNANIFVSVVKVFEFQCALFRELSNLVVREFLLEKSLCVSMRDKSSCQQAVSEQISCHSWPQSRDLLKMFDDITLRTFYIHRAGQWLP